MVLFNALCANLNYNSQRGHKSPTSFYVWFIVDLLIMIIITVGAIPLYNTVKIISVFFDNHNYLIQIIYNRRDTLNAFADSYREVVNDKSKLKVLETAAVRKTHEYRDTLKELRDKIKLLEVTRIEFLKFQTPED
uniref:Uncharacterized protein n=2 Tax=Trichobilharzia regenti TaxID=157069 RepID=A0AA85J1E3_TRIRE